MARGRKVRKSGNVNLDIAKLWRKIRKVEAEVGVLVDRADAARTLQNWWRERRAAMLRREQTRDMVAFLNESRARRGVSLLGVALRTGQESVAQIGASVTAQHFYIGDGVALAADDVEAGGWQKVISSSDLVPEEYPSAVGRVVLLQDAFGVLFVLSGAAPVKQRHLTQLFAFVVWSSLCFGPSPAETDGEAANPCGDECRASAGCFWENPRPPEACVRHFGGPAGFAALPFGDG